MRNLQHGEGLVERWFTFSVAAQLGHVGSEVSRALSWKTRNPEIAERALFRALELIDLTLEDPRHRSSLARLKEICRVRETLLDFFVGENEYRSTEASLRRYFDVMAVAAANGR